MNSNTRVASRWLNKTAHEVSVSMQGLLGMLHAVYWTHWTSHWQSRGSNSYGDHLLFERMYGDVKDEIDGIAEKMVAFYGVASVDPLIIQGYSLKFLETQQGGLAGDFHTGDPIANALSIERKLQGALEIVYQQLETGGKLSLGLDNFLQGIADKHETHIYLLEQRMFPNLGPK